MAITSKTPQPQLAHSVYTDECYLFIKIDSGVVRIPWSNCPEILRHATHEQRARLELSPAGYGIHWPDLDEDLSIAGLIGLAESD